MGSVDPSRIQKLKGTVILSPTSLSGSSPYGGTILGPVRSLAFHCGSRAQLITAEEWGGQTVDVLQGRDEARLAVFFRAWDSDALEAALPHSEDGSSGDRLWLYQPGADDEDTVRPGRGLAESYGVSLCVAPRSPDTQPVLVLYNAVPAVEATYQLRIALGHELGLAVVWHGLPDDSGRVFAFGLRGDITL